MGAKIAFTIVIPEKKPRSEVMQELISQRRYGKVHNDKTKYTRKSKHRKEWD